MFGTDSFTHCLNIEHLVCRTKCRVGMKHNRIMSWRCLVDFRFKDKLWLQYFCLGGSNCFFLTPNKSIHILFVSVCHWKVTPYFFFSARNRFFERVYFTVLLDINNTIVRYETDFRNWLAYWTYKQNTKCSFFFHLLFFYNEVKVILQWSNSTISN